ncbi:hypothetical protein [Sphingobium sp. R-21]|uniref:hypothetical protein n=1 Tax=Sphingobium sp. R-21 TaxID=3404056 RepID=UPI003CE97B03
MSIKAVPEELFDIPDNLSPGEYRHVCAQIAIQAITYAMGSREVKEGHASIAMPMLTEALAMAIAMLITADDVQQTPRDMRLSGEHFGKMIGGFASILKNGDDTTGTQLMAMLGVSKTKLN